jgi:hypothetical protein
MPDIRTLCYRKAIEVAFHSRLVKWATHKLVKKNKAIRLANAKRTIEELEDNKTV